MLSQTDLVKLFLVSEVIWIVGLFLAVTITRVSCTIPRLLLIATLPGVVLFFPLHFFLKLFLSTIVMFTLIVKLTDAKFYPDAVLMVGVANVFYLVIGLGLITTFS